MQSSGGCREVGSEEDTVRVAVSGPELYDAVCCREVGSEEDTVS